MRLKALTIKNFKGIDEQGIRIEFAPITMLFGPNNAGKSTVIQAMHLAREVFCSPTPDLDRVPIYGKGLDLGTFKDYVHRHQIDRTVYLKLEWDKVQMPVVEPNWDVQSKEDFEYFVDRVETPPIEKLGIEIGIQWNANLKKTVLTKFILSYNGYEFTEVQLDFDATGKSGTASISLCNPSPFMPQEAWNTLQSKAENVWKHIEAQAEGHENEYLNLLDDIKESIPDYMQEYASICKIFTDLGAPESLTNKLSKEEVRTILSEVSSSYAVFQWGEFIHPWYNDGTPLFADDDMSAEVAIQHTCLLSHLISTPGKMAKKFLNKLLYIGPIRDVPKRGILRSKKPSRARWANGLAAWDMISTAEDMQIQALNHALNEKLELGYTVQRKRLLSIDSESSLITSLKEVLLDDDLDESALPLLREFLEQEPEIRITLRNEQTEVEVEPQDMGLGVSQILPVVAATIFAKPNAFIAIEQPELHIHPKLQVKLGDIIIEAALKGDNAPLFLIETHSEHLLLRLLRRIRHTHEGKAPENLRITPDDIIVNWIGPTPSNNDDPQKQTYAIKLGIDEDGSFNTPWPEGFFDERGEELYK